ncbi:MAG: hypothetical protein EOO98_10380 [Pedobacter sp.]|nr:MAG: hypothetical protein EOO98_10380 [Pedobacter sp.]
MEEMNETMNENLSKKKVLVIGELLADLISEKDIESLAFSSGFVMSQGGSSANLCANLKWMNIDAELIGSVGDDGLGTYLINEIKEVIFCLGLQTGFSVLPGCPSLPSAAYSVLWVQPLSLGCGLLQ